MSIDADNDFARPVTLHPHEVEDLYWVLGTLEDWLLHASDEARAELDDLAGHRRGDLAVELLGRFSVALRCRGEGHQR
jgi:hypothetical protein